MTARPHPATASRPLALAIAGLAASAAAAAALSLAGPATARSARAAGAPACTAGGLVIWLNTQSNGAAGTIFYKLQYTNLSGRACTLRGYPGVSALSLTGAQLGPGASRLGGQRVRTVTLGADQTVSSTLGIVEAGVLNGCHMTTAARLRVFAPNQTASSSIPYPFQACTGRNKGVLVTGPVQ